MPVIDKHQTLLDFTMQHCGDASKVVEVAELNGIEITDDVAAGTFLIVPVVSDGEQLNIINSFTKQNIKPASSLVIDNTVALSGIEYWAIEDEFIIQ